MDALINKVIDGYKILEVRGRGGVGVVYKALDIELDRIVAMKMLETAFASDEVFLNRFKGEAKSLARSRHPNIVDIYALRKTEYGIFIIMEYVEGMTLWRRIHEHGPYSLKEGLEIFKEILLAIQHAHKSDVIHRDIKPRNVMITHAGEVKVMDFGLAKIQSGADITKTQERGGTLYYMPPEQIKGLAHVDERSDIYALGITLLEMLTGAVPFDKEESDYTIMQNIVKGELLSLSRYDDLIPVHLMSIISKAIKKEPKNRFQTVEEFLSTINALESLRKIEDQSDDETQFIFEDTDNNGHLLLRILLVSLLVIIVIVTLIFIYRPFIQDQKKPLAVSDTTNGNTKEKDTTMSKSDSVISSVEEYTDQFDELDNQDEKGLKQNEDAPKKQTEYATFQVDIKPDTISEKEIELRDTSGGKSGIIKISNTSWRIETNKQYKLVHLPTGIEADTIFTFNDQGEYRDSCYLYTNIRFHPYDADNKIMMTPANLKKAGFSITIKRLSNTEDLREVSPIELNPLIVGNYEVNFNTTGSYQIIQVLGNKENSKEPNIKGLNGDRSFSFNINIKPRINPENNLLVYKIHFQQMRKI